MCHHQVAIWLSKVQLAPTSRRPAASTQTTSWEAKRIHHVHDAGSAQTRAHVAPRQGIRTDVHYPWPRKSWWRRNGSAAASRGGGAPRDVVWWWRRRQLGGRCWAKEAGTSSISAPRRHGDRRRAIQLYHQHWSTSTVPGGHQDLHLQPPWTSRWTAASGSRVKAIPAGIRRRGCGTCPWWLCRQHACTEAACN